MTREETIKILMLVQAAYPNYKSPDKTITVNLWCRMLQEYTYQQVEAAVDAYIRTDKSGFAPSVGNIIDKIQMIFSVEDDVNEMVAWNMVLKAIRNSGYHAEEEFAKLPKPVQRAAVSPGQLREWALTENMNIEVVSSNFMRAYRIELERQKEIMKLQPEFRKRLESKDKQYECIGMNKDIRENHTGVPMSNELKEKFLKIMMESEE